MYVNKQRNCYITEKYEDLSDQFEKLFPDESFIGDDMLINNCNMHFNNDEDFSSLFNSLALSPVYQQMKWRLHILDYFLDVSLKSDGSYVECGVFRGFKSYFLFKRHKDKMNARNKYLFDTFEGIPEKYSDGSPISNDEHRKRSLHEFIINRFAEFDKTHIIKGTVPDSLKNVDVTDVSFLHLDMNSWLAEVGALEYFLPRMCKNSIVVLDDFGLFSHRAQMNHELPFLRARGYRILELPTGQGIIHI